MASEATAADGSAAKTEARNARPRCRMRRAGEAGRETGGGGADGAGGATKSQSDQTAEERLEAAAEELIDSEGGKPGHGGGGSGLGHGLLDGGNADASGNPLEEACLDPDGAGLETGD